MALLEVKGIYKSFGPLMTLQDVWLNVEENRITGLIGPNGSGKSTLFEIISGFQKADAGSVTLNGHRIDSLAPHKVAARGIMRTFQLSEGGQRLTTLENLLTAASRQHEHNLMSSVLGLARITRNERENLLYAKEVLGILGLTHVANEYVGNLSGGQRKLVDLGRVFMARSSLCLLDEPTAGVNPTLVNVILDALRRMNREHDISIFIVEHNMRVISEVCDFVYVLDVGTVMAEGTPVEIQTDPQVLESYLGGTRVVAG